MPNEEALEYYGLQLVIPPDVYHPAEDTDLFITFFDEWAERIETEFTLNHTLQILEIGCGPGTLSLYLTKILQEKKFDHKIYAIDINPSAILASKRKYHLNFQTQHTEYRAETSKINFLQGDLLEGLWKSDFRNSPFQFDIIFSNPPYLASDDAINDKNRKLIDLAWEGGKEGYELTLRIIQSLSPYFSLNGQFFFISSSLIPQEPILSELEKQHFEILNTYSQHVFFEDILLYECRKRN